MEARKDQALALKSCDAHHPSWATQKRAWNASSAPLRGHWRGTRGDVLLACQHVLLRLYPDGPGASQGDQNGTDPVPEPHGGSIGEQTTADPSHTNSPSARTSNNDEAVRHNSAPELQGSRFCWEPDSASNPQFQSILSSVLHISECSDRTSDRFMRFLHEVLWCSRSSSRSAGGLPRSAAQSSGDGSYTTSVPPLVSCARLFRPKRTRVPKLCLRVLSTRHGSKSA